MPPEWPEAANITQDSEAGIGSWSKEDFVRALREGRRPDGTELRAEFMPWPSMGQLYEEEMDALWMYLSSVEARPSGGR